MASLQVYISHCVWTLCFCVQKKQLAWEVFWEVLDMTELQRDVSAQHLLHLTGLGKPLLYKLWLAWTAHVCPAHP